MFTITCSKVPSSPKPVFETPTEQAKARIAKAVNNGKKRNRHWRQHMYAHPSQEEVANRALSKGSERIREMEIEIERYKQVNAKLERLAKWNLRSSQSSLKTSEEMIQLLQDTFGDEAFEKTEDEK